LCPAGAYLERYLQTKSVTLSPTLTLTHIYRIPFIREVPPSNQTNTPTLKRASGIINIKACSDETLNSASLQKKSGGFNAPVLRMLSYKIILDSKYTTGRRSLRSTLRNVSCEVVPM